MVHLDSIDINEINTEEFGKQFDPTIKREGLRCSVSYVLQYFQEREGMNPQNVWKQIEDAVVKSVLSAEIFITTATQKKFKFRKTAFDLFGFDILVDKNHKVFLIFYTLFSIVNLFDFFFQGLGVRDQSCPFHGSSYKFREQNQGGYVV